MTKKKEMKIEIIAKTRKFVPASQRAKRVLNANVKLKKRVVHVANTIKKTMASKGNPRLKNLRIKKLKALQTYFQAAIIYNNARVKELKNPS